MSRSLPLRASLEWLKKHSKDRLGALRATNPDAQLSDAQLDVAREFGFRHRTIFAHIHQQIDHNVARNAVDPIVSGFDGDFQNWLRRDESGGW